jgi:bifunctional NMN adenylyltransferase/nudix hydrolase
MREAHNYILGYKAMWEAPSKVPFPVIFTTVDAVVIKAGHILLVERGRNPGKGLLALPGGFLNPHEELLDGALRELKEETKIVASKKVLAESVRSSHVFAHPDRSLRGRTITHAYLIDLGINGPLPAVKGSDDAAQAMWVPLHRVYELQETFFEDHFHIIEYFTRK